MLKWSMRPMSVTSAHPDETISISPWVVRCSPGGDVIGCQGCQGGDPFANLIRYDRLRASGAACGHQ
jgi:hypothetical protein